MSSLHGTSQQRGLASSRYGGDENPWINGLGQNHAFWRQRLSTSRAMSGTESTFRGDRMKTHAAARSARREWTIRLALLLVSLIVALLIAEVVTRIVHPIWDGRDNVTLDGKPIKGWFEPGSVYRQISNEYDAITTITDKGHRVPGVDGNPEVVFLGDSFTYGYGLSDEETFASIYCKRLNVPCVNLGIPSTGTLQQVVRLEEFLDKYGWRPREVKLFFFGMSSSFSAGNDFVDNYYRRNWVPGATRQPASAATAERNPEPAPGLKERIIGLQVFLLSHSNLVRLAKFYWGPMLKTMIVADPGEERMEEAIVATQQALRRLDDASRRFGFEYRIYLIVPVHDILRGTDDETLDLLRSTAGRPIVSTADAVRDSPKDSYYAFDGHLSPEGSRRVAEFLIQLDDPPHSAN